MKTVLALIRTSPSQSLGSMSAYSTLVRQALDCTEPLFSEIRFCDLFAPFRGRSMWFHHVWRFIHARRLLKATNADLYHLLDGSMCGFIPSEFRQRTVATVHDLIPALQMNGDLPESPSLPATWLIRRTLRALPNVAGIAADSAHTLQDLQRLTGTTTEGPVIPLAVRPFSRETVAGRHVMPSRYILHVGNSAQYKNRQGVVEVFARLHDLDDLHLIMAGPEPDFALRQKVQGFKRVSFQVDPPDGLLRNLYDKAALLLFPSLYEGFGMPVLEAMAAGCPVVCSDGGSLPEVTGNAALRAPASDCDALACHCRALLENPRLHQEQVKRGLQHAAQFTMERFSSELHAWYRDVLENQRRIFPRFNSHN